MDDVIPDDAIRIRDIDDEMMRQIEARARATGRTVEQETLALIKIALSLAEADG